MSQAPHGNSSDFVRTHAMSAPSESGPLTLGLARPVHVPGGNSRSAAARERRASFEHERTLGAEQHMDWTPCPLGLRDGFLYKIRTAGPTPRSGQISVIMVFFVALTVTLITGFVFLATTFLQLSVREFNKSLAFSVAEAGIEYYRWHLAHAQSDYWDGQGATSTGPYVHNYYNKDGILIGTFSLDITPPPVGSTVVKVRSTGKVTADSSIDKVIEVRMAIPSFAKYAWVLNDYVRFGSTAEVFGLVHSNSGLRFDGIAHNLVTSAQSTFDDPDHSGGNEFGVHTHSSPTDPLPPAAVPARPDVFMAGRQFPVPAVDFAGITQDLADIQSAASSSGFYATSSGAFGYDLVFATSGTFTVYKVTALTSPPVGCSSGQTGWGTWSVQTESVYATGTIPTNGYMFFEDHVWVRGQINGKRVTVGSGKFPDNPSTRTNIIVNNDLRYTNFDGTDSIALLAQNNFNVGLISEDDLRIDAALVAQNGRVGRHSYSSSCGSTSSRTLLTSYGILGTALRPAFLYSSSNGYQARNYIYDSNLLYAPPPGFPLTTDQYTIISWSEVK